ncbi:hypothetical protein BC936DRAFT_138747 [Jimgerdemannia flammicorona]|uniref:Uncharacterized protein n=1 Tax=Jimgerdemannia flammicorona TaxID=994334 RepID=A0A433BLL8_9FUNG|nr:hypothetical protein BC936DRAFT_138747 [Jimgerdemannia flammicorona]
MNTNNATDLFESPIPRVMISVGVASNFFYDYRPMVEDVYQPQAQDLDSNPQLPVQDSVIPTNTAQSQTFNCAAAPTPVYEPAVDYQWGFLLENTFFIAFDANNNLVLERCYRRPNRSQTRWIEITDTHLNAPAKVYFGVESNHLRMPGTRYTVLRKNTHSRPYMNNFSQ